MGENREWLKTWVDKQGKDLSPEQKEKALDVAEIAFKGQTGVGEASQIGVDAIKKLESKQ